VLVVGAGSNGGGKTTFVETFLKPTGLRIVNPDQIARALSPDPQTPSRMRLPNRIRRGKSREAGKLSLHLDGGPFLTRIGE